jgi:hypothetical protein
MIKSTKNENALFFETGTTTITDMQDIQKEKKERNGISCQLAEC